MFKIIIESIFWILAIYGLIELINNFFMYTCSKIKTEGIHIIVTVKNQENQVEAFLRNFLFRILYGKEDLIKEIMVVDLDSTDDTYKIISNLQEEYSLLSVCNWKECKDYIEHFK